MGILYNYLFIDLPEAIIALMAGFAVFNQVFWANWRKALLFSFLFSVMTTISSQFWLPYQAKMLLLFFWMNILVYYLFRFKLWLTIGICTCSFIFSITAEFFVLMFYQALDINVEQLFNRPILLYSAVWFYLFLLVCLIVLMRKFHFDIRMFVPKSKQNRFLALLLLVGGIEFLLILSLNTSSYIERNNQLFLNRYIITHIAIYQVIILLLFIAIIFLFWKYITLTISLVEVETEKPYLQNIQDMVTAIRSIKHDGINHYTALDGFLKVERYDLAADYVKHLLKEANDLVQVVEGIKNPAVSALLHSKMAICVANHVSFQLVINSSLQFEKIKSKDLTAMLGNLLDNAIHATLQGDTEERFIRMEWGESDKEQFLLIENSGPTIPLDKQEQIFSLGYTTRSSGEGGVGLAVVKSTIDRYSGTITLKSEHGVTRFSIYLQK